MFRIMLMRIMVFGAIMNITFGLLSDQKLEMKEIKSMKHELKELKSVNAKLEAAFTKLISAIKIASGDKVKTAVEETDGDGIYLDNISLNDLVSLLRGRDGKDGRDGLTGLTGRDGIPGPKGIGGLKGAPGQQGGTGRDGIAGPKGAPGQQGVTGETGRDGIAGVKGSIGEPGHAARVGSVYTRWGRKSCGSNSTMLYEGFTAGGYHSHSGGGVDYQCLPLNPQFDQYTYSGNEISWIYGTEYHTNGFHSSIPSGAYNQNVPCARCYSTHSAVMMVPARRDCPTGWSVEYYGYLMSAYYNHPHPATYECVDGSPEYVTGQQGNVNGALFYFVKTACSGSGAIGHCPPYSDDKWVQCVVCTK